MSRQLNMFVGESLQLNAYQLLNDSASTKVFNTGDTAVWTINQPDNAIIHSATNDGMSVKVKALRQGGSPTITVTVTSLLFGPFTSPVINLCIADPLVHSVVAADIQLLPTGVASGDSVSSDVISTPCLFD